MNDINTETIDFGDSWLLPALVLESITSMFSSHQFAHIEYVHSNEIETWKLSRLDAQVFINDEDLTQHQPLVNLMHQLYQQPNFKYLADGRTALVMSADQWEAVIPDYIIAKRYLDPLRIWQRNHENNRNERRRSPFSDEKDPFPTFEAVFERAMQHVKKTQRPLQVVGGSWISGDDRSKIYLHPDGSLEVEPGLIL